MSEAATEPPRGCGPGAGDGALAAWLSLCSLRHRGMDAILNLQGRARMCWAHGEGGRALQLMRLEEGMHRFGVTVAGGWKAVWLGLMNV